MAHEIYLDKTIIFKKNYRNSVETQGECQKGVG